MGFVKNVAAGIIVSVATLYAVEVIEKKRAEYRHKRRVL